MDRYILILSTVNKFEIAKEISSYLVENKLAACVNIIPKVTSIYYWDNKVCEDNEYLILIKTVKDNFSLVKQYIESVHPYDLPEIISVDISGGSNEYLDWISSSLK